MFKKESKNWIVMLENGPFPYYHESNVIFVNFRTLLQSIDSYSYSYPYSYSSFVLDKILIHKHEHEHEDEDDYEKYQIRSPESALI